MTEQYGRSPAQVILPDVRLLNWISGPEVLECFSFEQAVSEMADKLGVPTQWMKRPPGRNYVLLKQYEG